MEGATPCVAVLIKPLAPLPYISGLNSTWLDQGAVLMQAASAIPAEPEAPLVIDVVGVSDHNHHARWVLMLDWRGERSG